MTKIRPLPGYVLIEPIEDEAKQGNVYLPETSKDKPMKGKVIAIGGAGFIDGNLVDITEEVTIGQEVIYKKWVNETVNENGKEYLFVRFEDLLGVYDS